VELDTPGLATQRLALYEERLRDQSERLGLVSTAGLENFATLLLDPCLRMGELPALCAARNIVDLGSGNGLPGIPVAILHPDKPVLLVDSRLKRCQFLTDVAAALELEHVRVLHARVEKVRAEAPPDLFICRFFKDLRLMAAWTRHWRVAGTRYLVVAGQEESPQPAVYDLTLQGSHPLSAGKVALEYLAG